MVCALATDILKNKTNLKFNDFKPESEIFEVVFKIDKLIRREKAETIFDGLLGEKEEDNPYYDILEEKGNHTIVKEEDYKYNFYSINVIDGGLLSSNVDAKSYTVTYTDGNIIKSTHDPFNDSLIEVASSINRSSNIEVSVTYRNYSGGPVQKIRVRFKEIGGYTINLI